MPAPRRSPRRWRGWPASPPPRCPSPPPSPCRTSRLPPPRSASHHHQRTTPAFFPNGHEASQRDRRRAAPTTPLPGPYRRVCAHVHVQAPSLGASHGVESREPTESSSQGYTRHQPYPTPTIPLALTAPTAQNSVGHESTVEQTGPHPALLLARRDIHGAGAGARRPRARVAASTERANAGPRAPLATHQISSTAASPARACRSPPTHMRLRPHPARHDSSLASSRRAVGAREKRNRNHSISLARPRPVPPRRAGALRLSPPPGRAPVPESATVCSLSCGLS